MDADFQKILDKLYKRSLHSTLPTLSEETYILAIESAYNMVIITDKKGMVLYANKAVERITGYPREEVIGKKLGLWGGMMSESYYNNLWKTIMKGEVFFGELENHRKNGDSYLAQITISPIINNGKVTGFVGTEEDITLEKKLQKEKEEFISLASHQLRTPLGAMKWGLELLADENPTIEADISNLAEQNQLMIDLVNRLLIVMRIADNRLKVKKEIVSMEDLLKSAISNAQLKIKKRKITFTIHNPYKKLNLNTDSVLLKEILSNSIDNAIKYSKNKGKIILSISKTKTHWTFVVQDNGIGIPSKDLPFITDKFYRGSNTVSIPGTGLGMYIASTYTHLLKGTMKVKSIINRGTEIQYSFPLK